MKKKGLTLVELIVTLGVIAILLAVVTPVIANYLPGVQLNGASRSLISNLREMQEKAITEQNQHLIRFYPLNLPPSYQMIRIYNSLEEVIREETLANSQTLTLEETITDNTIIFSPDGGPNVSGNITIGNGTSSKIISVSPAGYIKLQ